MVLTSQLAIDKHCWAESVGSYFILLFSKNALRCPHIHTHTDSAVVLVESTHLQTLKELIWEVGVHWRALAGALSVPHDTVEDIHHDILCRSNGDRLEKALTEWMRSGTATIHDLLTALNNPTVNCGHVSRRLRALQGEARLKLGLCKTDCSLCLS